jgi:CBS domain-containing protein
LRDFLGLPRTITDPVERIGEDGVINAAVTCVGPAESIETCMTRMTHERVRHLPVVDGGRVVGIVSIGDLLKSIIDEQRTTIHELEGYIHSELHTQ